MRRRSSSVKSAKSAKSGFRWKLNLFITIGVILFLLVAGGIVSLFLFEIEDVIYADGRIASDIPYEIISHVEGRVIALNYEEGADVRAGDVIALVDSTQFEEEYIRIEGEILEFEAEREVRKAELAALERNPLPKELWYAETNLTERLAKLERAIAQLDRARLLAKSNTISQKEFEDSEVAYIQARAELARARENMAMVQSGLGEHNIEKARRDIALVEAKIAARRAALKLVARSIEDCRLVAPADGRLVNLPCKYTMYVQKGAVAAKMSSGDALKGVAYVDESIVRKVRRGLDVRVSSGVFNRLKFGSFHGKVTRIHDTPETDAAGRTKYPVEIVIDPEGRMLKLGSSAEFAIIAGREPVIVSIFGLSKDDFSTTPAD